MRFDMESVFRLNLPVGFVVDVFVVAQHAFVVDVS